MSGYCLTETGNPPVASLKNGRFPVAKTLQAIDLRTIASSSVPYLFYAMKKLACLLLLTVLVECTSKKTPTDQQQDSTSTTATTTASIHPPCSFTIAFTVVGGAPIGYVRADSLYDRFRAKIRDSSFPRHLCDTTAKNDTLRYLRVLKGDLCSHVHINEAKLPEANSNYTGIRLYPINKMGLSRFYLLVYTKPVNTKFPNGSQEDKPESIYLIRTATPDTTWCRLRESVKRIEALDKNQEAFLTSHHLCSPVCPEDDGDEPLFNL